MIEAILAGIIAASLPLQLIATVKILYTLRDVENCLLYMIVKGEDYED